LFRRQLTDHKAETIRTTLSRLGATLGPRRNFFLGHLANYNRQILSIPFAPHLHQYFATGLGRSH
jgi:hypothetical protein